MARGRMARKGRTAAPDAAWSPRRAASGRCRASRGGRARDSRFSLPGATLDAWTRRSLILPLCADDGSPWQRAANASPKGQHRSHTPALVRPRSRARTIGSGASPSPLSTRALDALSRRPGAPWGCGGVSGRSPEAAGADGYPQLGPSRGFKPCVLIASARATGQDFPGLLARTALEPTRPAIPPSRKPLLRSSAGDGE